MKGLLGAALLVMVLPAQAALPRPLEITEPRNAAVGFALTRAGFVEKILQSCATLPGFASSSATVGDRWRARNRPYLAAAMGWMSYVEFAVREQSGEAASRAFVGATRETFAREASNAIDAVLPGGTAEPGRCGMLLDQFDRAAHDVAVDSEFRRDLEDIRTFHEAVVAAAET